MDKKIGPSAHQTAFELPDYDDSSTELLGTVQDAKDMYRLGKTQELKVCQIEPGKAEHQNGS